ncbi:multiubiquitin domain-containing protein [Burkholderia ubonensis]|uniref:multiubiquitin domain-containing protein n=1 Tax=Burkholderia ubonensis TaxID=101571 RepID=UPI0009B48BD7|nr:multiubiquitin domain-containing protein [Burkholderia ubonensis]
MESTKNTPDEYKSEAGSTHEERRVDVEVKGGEAVDVVVKDGEIDIVTKDENGDETTVVVHTEHDNGHHHPPFHVVHIRVNEKSVTVRAHELTGLQIKQAAIDAGIAIQLDFVLAEERPDGTSRIIGDAEVVKLHSGMEFSAIRDDDNS